ncbi:MAG: hypothetical protein LCH52_03890 [Bacteroidetes bacterium]|nr:hypothetical protein [Bacteroidota bacterium]
MKTNTSKSKNITITMRLDTINELKLYSQESLIPMSALIQKLVETFLNNQKSGGSNE